MKDTALLRHRHVIAATRFSPAFRSCIPFFARVLFPARQSAPSHGGLTPAFLFVNRHAGGIGDDQDPVLSISDITEHRKSKGRGCRFEAQHVSFEIKIEEAGGFPPQTHSLIAPTSTARLCWALCFLHEHAQVLGPVSHARPSIDSLYCLLPWRLGHCSIATVPPTTWTRHLNSTMLPWPRSALPRKSSPAAQPGCPLIHRML